MAFLLFKIKTKIPW